MLIGAGYEVFGTTRNPGKTAQMEAIGVHPVLVDVFDRASLIAAVGEAKPDVIIHQLTDLSAADFAATDRLRIDGTRNLVDAAKAAGVRRMIAQSLAIVYAPGAEPATEQDPLADGSPSLRDTVKGVRSLEAAVEELPEGIILRYGLLYGPGTWYSRIGSFADAVRQGERARRRRRQFIRPCGRCRAGGDARDRLAGGCRQYRRRRTCCRHRMAAALRRGDRSAAPADGRARRWRARRLESQGPAGTRMETAAPDLAGRVPGSRDGN